MVHDISDSIKNVHNFKNTMYLCYINISCTLLYAIFLSTGGNLLIRFTIGIYKITGDSFIFNVYKYNQESENIYILNKDFS